MDQKATPNLSARHVRPRNGEAERAPREVPHAHLFAVIDQGYLQVIRYIRQASAKEIWGLRVRQDSGIYKVRTEAPAYHLSRRIHASGVD